MPEQAELELLDRPARCFMGVSVLPELIELASQHFCDTGGIVARHRQATAPFRAIWRECSDDNDTTGFQRCPNRVRISALTGCIGQEVKRRAVMPDVIAVCGLPARYVGDDPFDMLCSIAQSRLCNAKCIG